MTALRLTTADPLIIVPVMSQDPATLLPDMQRVIAAGAPAVEWRADAVAQALDAAAWLDALLSAGDALDALWASTPDAPPLIATVRTAAEGGHRELTRDEYAHAIMTLAHPRCVSGVDVEALRAGRDAPALVAAARAGRADTERTVLASHHDFERTPALAQCLEIFEALADSGADVLKLAVTPQREEDVLTLLRATLQRSRIGEQPLITISMGELGALSRLGGHVMGSTATFATVGQASAPGQLSLEQVRTALSLLSGR